MKRSALLLLSLFFVMPAFLRAQEETPPSLLTVVLNQDNAFGFYPAVFGNIGVTETSGVTFYSIFWTNASYGSPTIGTDLWTEVGAGWSWLGLNDRLLINPSIGITNGKLMSGGVHGVIGDGIVPSLTAFYLDNRFEVELFGAYYKAMRREGPVTSDFLLYWIYPGIRFSNTFSAGFHAESFVLTRTDGGDPGTFYTWVGAYVKATILDAYSLRFSAGKNFTENSGYSPEYYKLNLVIPIGL